LPSLRSLLPRQRLCMWVCLLYHCFCLSGSSLFWKPTWLWSERAPAASVGSQHQL